MMSRLLLSTLTLALLAVRASAAAPPSVGQLLDVKGGVEILRAGQPSRRGTLLSPLLALDRLVVPAGGSAEVVLFRNGVRFVLVGPSAARVEPRALQRYSGAAPKPLPAIGQPFIRQMSAPFRPASARILGVLVRSAPEGDVGPRAPSPNGAVRDPSVTLHWAGPIEGEQLRVRISTEEQTIYRSELAPTARELKLPPGTLKPGVPYLWSVTAVTDGERGHECRAVVRLLLPRERADLEAMEREAAAARRQDAGDPAPLLLLGQAYERLDLRDDARAAYESVLRLRPGDEGVRAALARLASRPGRVQSR